MAASSYYTQVQQLYVSYFGRPADAGGLDYYAKLLDKNGGDDKAMLHDFATSDESAKLYNQSTLEAKIASMYWTLFGREGDFDGIAYWASEVKLGNVILSEVAAAIAFNAQPEDRAAFEAKLAAADAFTAAINTTAELLAYAADQSAARAWLLSVKDEATKDEALATVNSTLETIVTGNVPVPVAKTFTLTASVDEVVGGAGDDVVNATGTTLSALDKIDGGAGKNTLNITDATGTLPVSLPAGATLSNIQNVNINTIGNVGQVTTAGSGATAAVKEIDTLEFTVVDATSTSTLDVTYDGITLTTAALDGNVTSVSEVNTLVIAAINQIAGSTIASEVGGKVVVTAPNAGIALPAISVVASTANDISFTKADTRANAAAQAEVAATTAAVYDLSSVGGLETFTATAAGVVNVKIADTTSAIIGNNAAKSVTVAGGKSVNVTNGAAAITVSGTSGLQSVVTSGGTTVDITTTAVGTAADTLKSVSVSGNTGAVNVQSDALTSLSVANTNQNVTVSAAAGTRQLDLTLNKVTGGNFRDDTATTVAVTTAGADKIAGVTITTDAATAVNFFGHNATSVTLADTGNNAAVVTSISAAEHTGGVTVLSDLGTGIAFTGSAAADAISVGATTKAIEMGAGNDKVTLSSATLGSGGSINGGEGTDTLVLSAANAVTASGGKTFAAVVKGFDVLELGINGSDTAVVNLTNLNDTDKNAFGKVTLGANTHSLEISGLLSGNTVEFTGAISATKTTKLSLADTTGTADVLNVGITTNNAAIDVRTVEASGVETINFVLDDKATTPAGIKHTAALTDAAAKTITVSGDAGLALSFTGTALTTFDASGVTKGAVEFTTAALANEATIKGGAGANTITFSAATKAVTYTGGAGVDDITAVNANDNVINTAGGADIVKLGSGKNTVDLGAGDDTITLGANLNVVTLGAGNDIVKAAITTNGNTYSTLNDFVKGDTISFVDASVATIANGTVGAAVTLGTTAAFADFLNAAAAGFLGDAANSNTNDASLVKWFQFGGDTYVVLDNSDANTFQNGVDSIVKLVGTIDLSKATLTGEVLSLA